MIPAANGETVEAPGFTFAFQPIVDTHTGTVYSHEALVRGLNNESAYQILQQYAGERMIAFDAACRVKAIEVASRIGIHTHLNLNFLPSAVLNVADGMKSTIEAAERHSFPPERIILEATEVEAIGSPAHFASVVNEYRRAGMRLAIDDFGAGYAGLSLLAEFQPDILKLDMSLVRGIHAHGPRQAIVRGISQVCVDLGIDFVVEGVETIDEYAWFNDLGASLYQGYLFAKPMFEGMPDFYLPPRKESFKDGSCRHRVAD
ncbi:MAG: EAL domain-containing protein [Thiobacillus sp.]